MYRYIGIEDLIASALIELMKHKKSNRKVSLQTLADFGTVIVKNLTNSGQDAILFLTKDSTYEFVHDYSDFFSIEICDEMEYIALKECITVEDLRYQFRKNFTVDLAKAILKEESLKALKISAGTL